MSQVRSGQVRSGQVRSGQVRSGQVRSGQVRSDLVKSSQVKSSQVKSSQVKSSQVKSSQVLKKLIPVVEQTADVGPGEQWNDGGHQHEVDQLVKNKIFKLAKFTLKKHQQQLIKSLVFRAAGQHIGS